jgi:hypothetical protein
MQAEIIAADESAETIGITTDGEGGAESAHVAATQPDDKQEGQPAQDKKSEHHGVSPSNGYDVPSRRLSILIEGRDYLKYRETFERLLFAEKMTPAQKDARILKLAMDCLTEKMEAVSATTGDPFIRAELVAG